ncbi:MAG: hypothetical protein NTW17_00535 [Candidatus Pacearchaeota archaeon]|nr:hypothetical protein [Candidatus Pacearchaeota archaeon]
MPDFKILMCFLFLLIGLINIGCVASQENVALSINIEPEYSIVSVGDNVIMQINLIQLGDQKRRDVIVSLSLIGNENKIIYESTQTIALETRASLISQLRIPENTDNGIYNVNVEILDMTEKNLLGKASKEIVVEKSVVTRIDVYLVGFYLTLIGLFVLVIMLYEKNKMLNSKAKITKFEIETYLKQREKGK